MNERPEHDEEITARLMRLAGPRAEIPADVESRVYERVFAEWTGASENLIESRVYESVQRSWKSSIDRARFFRWAAPIAVAASVFVMAIYVAGPAPVPAATIGKVARIVGAEDRGDSLQVGDDVIVGAVLTTGDGDGLSLLLTQNESLRIGENSRLQVDSRNHFTLLEGRLYADTGQFAYRNKSLQIDAGFATVRDIGTQFAVTFDGTAVDVAVREGRVDVQRADEQLVAVAGERMIIGERGGAVTQEIAPTATYGSWATGLAPKFELENKSVMEFLNWAARESGMELVFEDDELRMAAMRTDLHGSIASFTPLEAIASVRATTSFRHRIESGRIYIER